MKPLGLLVSALVLLSCNQRPDEVPALQARVAALEARLASAYKPGLGELMGGIQSHHAKRWFAGQNANWKLAEFEVHELTETLNNVRTLQGQRPESKLIGMLDPALQDIGRAIEHRDAALFRSGYNLLTTACNNCHRATNFGFNVVQTPDRQAFGNQHFGVRR